MSGSREVATEVATTELLAERSAAPGGGPALRPVPMPNFSGAQTDERLVELSLARKVGYLPSNVGAAVELPKVKDTLSERTLTEAGVHRIMNAPKGAFAARDRALLCVLYAGALRREEAVRLKWRDLKDRDDLGPGVGQATLFGKGSKTGVALLPASVYSQVLGLRKVTESTSTGEKIE